ncbi:hypothetical protein ACFQ08_32540 [Streptosporangium algeriense]|uniref:Uncharacterized protein n=1 Tax=Streptosporangium algeriense TaxID=1682748 RepID=A0ABW3DZP8_9ACTN
MAEDLAAGLADVPVELLAGDLVEVLAEVLDGALALAEVLAEVLDGALAAEPLAAEPLAAGALVVEALPVEALVVEALPVGVLVVEVLPVEDLVAGDLAEAAEEPAGDLLAALAEVPAGVLAEVPVEDRWAVLRFVVVFAAEDVAVLFLAAGFRVADGLDFEAVRLRVAPPV